MGIEYQSSPLADPSAAVDFAARLNVLTEHRIAFLGDTRREIANDLMGTYKVADTAVTAQRDGDIVGFLGADLDEELGRAYLYGPLVDDDAWDTVSDELYERTLALLPHGIDHLNLFYDLANRNLEAFARRHGFAHYKDNYQLGFERARLDSLPPEGAEEAGPGHRDELVALHDRLFPATWLPGPKMFAEVDEHKKLFVRSDEERALGYVYATVEPATWEATIEYVGTVEDARGRGIATALVASAMRWMFSFPQVGKTWLSLDRDNGAARRVYEKLGWHDVFSSRAMVLKR